MGTFNLGLWLLWAMVAVFGFISALKRTCERATERYCARRKLRRARQTAAGRKVEIVRGHAAAVVRSRQEPTLIYAKQSAGTATTKTTRQPFNDTGQP